MFIMNGQGRILKIWGGYSPKVYDSHVFDIIQEYFERKFSGGTVIADAHFAGAEKTIKSVKFLVNIPERPKPKKRKREEALEEDNIASLTKKEEKFNAQHHGARARVEQTFADFSHRFSSPTKPWFESKKQHKNVVRIASAIHNMIVT